MALAIGMGSLALLAVIACFVLGLKLSKAAKAEVEAIADANREKSARLDVIAERDLAVERAGKLAAEVADLSARLTATEQERNELAEKLARAVTARVAAAPLDEGAAIVNEIFAWPLPGARKEKP